MRVQDILSLIDETRGEAEFMPTGFTYLDHVLDGGFMRKELVALGGSTGSGKSNLAGQITLNIARSGFKTAYLSLEISNEMVLSRLIGAEANIKPNRILHKQLSEEEEANKNSTANRLTAYADYMEFYDDKYTFEEIKKTIIDGGYEFIVVDFIQNVEITGMDEYTRLTTISRQLQKLAKEQNCCIMVLSQLSNAVANTPADKGSIEYRGSGAIAHVCDLGFFIQRTKGDDGNESLGLLLKKNRRGNSNQLILLDFQQPGGKICQKQA